MLYWVLAAVFLAIPVFLYLHDESIKKHKREWENEQREWERKDLLREIEIRKRKGLPYKKKQKIYDVIYRNADPDSLREEDYDEEDDDLDDGDLSEEERNK